MKFHHRWKQGRRRSSWVFVGIALGVMTLTGACDGRDKKALGAVAKELDLLKPPSGITGSDEKTGLGEMYAEGTRTYCVENQEAGRVGLDSMLRDAGWVPITPSAPEVTVWRYAKGQGLGTLSLDGKQAQCGWRLRVDVAEPI
jgi:hypothetical protein